MVQKYFPHDCSTDNISCSEWGGKESDENNIKTRQRLYLRQDSVTVSNLKASEISTLLLLSIHRARRRSAAASVVAFDSLDASSILRRRIRCCCCILRAHIPLPKPPPSSYIPWARRLAPVASVVVSDSLYTLRILRPMPKPPSFLLSPMACLNMPTSPSLLSIP